MKKLICLGMILASTSLLATPVSGTIGGNVNTENTDMKSVKEITLQGKAVKAVKIETETTEVQFGTVVIGKYSTANVPFKVTGEPNSDVKLTAIIEDINGAGANVTISGVPSDAIKLTEVGKDVDMVLVYTPKNTGEELNTTLTLTATYQ
ncbi:MAG: hypothetical protein ACRC8M_01795 [Cetobacterium sp.]|uniref:hypothetical protein n=1 Tax=Cetobacterium sp. TaxID=2071632 RepID=UPI003F3005C7